MWQPLLLWHCCKGQLGIWSLDGRADWGKEKRLSFQCRENRWSEWTLSIQVHCGSCRNPTDTIHKLGGWKRQVTICVTMDWESPCHRTDLTGMCLKEQRGLLCRVSSDPFVPLDARGPSAFMCEWRNAAFISVLLWKQPPSPPPPSFFIINCFQIPDSSWSRLFPFASISTLSWQSHSCLEASGHDLYDLKP